MYAHYSRTWGEGNPWQKSKRTEPSLFFIFGISKWEIKEEKDGIVRIKRKSFILMGTETDYDTSPSRPFFRYGFQFIKYQNRTMDIKKWSFIRGTPVFTTSKKTTTWNSRPCIKPYPIIYTQLNYIFTDTKVRTEERTGKIPTLNGLKKFPWRVRNREGSFEGTHRSEKKLESLK